MDLTNKSEYLALVRRASNILFKIPGVFSVGVGHKWIGGRNTGQLALSVMVLEKKTGSALPLNEIIPSEIEGIQTDVVEGHPPRPIADEEEAEDFESGIPRDTDEHRPILGGIQIRGARGSTVDRKKRFGTLGCFATTTGKDPGKHVLLTNHHVLADPIGQLHGPSCTGCTKGDGVGNPDSGSQIATVLDGKNNDVLDAAIAILDAGTKFQQDVIKDGEPVDRAAIAGSRPLTTSDLHAPVHKRGMRSRLTTGAIGAIGAAIEVDGKTKQNQIRIDLVERLTQAATVNFQANGTVRAETIDFAAAGVVHNDVLWIEGPANPGRFRITEVHGAHEVVVAATLTATTAQAGVFVTPPLFALKGDSGSVLLDGQERVVGLVWAAFTARRRGNAWANAIEAVEDGLHIRIDTATTVGNTQTARHGSEDTDVEPDRVERLRPAAAAATRSSQPQRGYPGLKELVEHDLLPHTRGRQIYGLYFTHHSEIRELLNTNRHVALVWHRQGGPGIIQSVLDAVRSREQAIPSVIRGRSWRDRVVAILAIFDKHGSERLRNDIARFGHEVQMLGGMTYPGFLESLKA